LSNTIQTYIKHIITYDSVYNSFGDEHTQWRSYLDILSIID